MKTLLLIDGSSYLFRAFHALPPLTTSDGRPTGAIHGVLNMIRKLLREYRPDYVAVVFDAPGKTFRDEIYEEYKANRPPTPEELSAQIEPLHEIIRAMGLPLLMVEGVEADDVIGTLARQAEQEGIRTVISTSDKDMAQLVNDHITLVNTMSNTVLDREGVVKKFGVAPEQIIDYLALVGDTSDNIPGIPKVGPKTAAKWLQQYGSLDGIIAHADEIKGKVGESLRASLDQLALSRELATIRCDVPLEVKPGELVPGEPDRQRLIELYRDLQFRSFLEELLHPPEEEEEGTVEDDAPPVDYELVLDRLALDLWLEKLRQAELFAFDTETTSLDYMQAELVGLSFAVEPGHAAYVPVAHRYPGAPRQLSREEVLEAMRPLLEDEGRAKIGHNLKYDMSVLARHGIELRGIACDTMLESYVADSTAARHDMDSLVLKYLGLRTIHYEDVAGKGRKQLRFDEVPLEAAAPYAAEDADMVLRLHDRLIPQVRALPGVEELLLEIEVPLIPVLSRMERNGVMVDAQMLARQSAELAQKMARLEAKAHELAGQPFNLGSPKQIQEILYDKLGLPVLAKTPKGQPSTAESVLAELALDYPLPAVILEYRSVSKLKSTYTDKLPEQIDPDTGRVHTSFHQAVAATGRLSSSDPNLQNIPIRTEEGRRIRQAFIAPSGYRLVAADYSQIELRIMAHLSADEALLEAFSRGEDIHRATAAQVFGVAPEQVSDEQRRAAKAINFGLIYGMSAFGLAKQLGIDRSAAREYVDAYFARYPGVAAYMDRIKARARLLGYVETLFHRRLYLPEIDSRNAARRQYAERTAINAPMQGTAADIIKRAMIAVDRWLLESGVDARLILQVHDELVLEVAEGEVEEVTATLRELMTGAAELAVPLVVDIGVGGNWDEAH
ncbi:MAG: DNA polymerase I [Gammaproteobacteria bacterium]|nr:MAG: DNA polymerase I [Gammaproteobacteria bacterium]